MFNSLTPQVVLQEVPGEISLLFTITGCQLNCQGCHSAEIHDETYGEPLSELKFESYLNKYQGFITCVLFFGGEWQRGYLTKLLAIAKRYQFKTCLYSGKDNLPKQLLSQLDFVKLGKWQAELGGLNSLTTNQRFIDLKTNCLLNEKFQR